MKKRMMVLFACVLLLAGCAAEEAVETTTETQGNMRIANPWTAYETLAEAEAAVGFSLPLPETVADSYHAESFRVMNGELLEAVYRDEAFEVTVRMIEGEGQDISGVYTVYETEHTHEFEGGQLTVKYGAEDNSCLQLISCGGYSYSLYAPNGYWGDSNGDFLRFFGIQ